MEGHQLPRFYRQPAHFFHFYYFTFKWKCKDKRERNYFDCNKTEKIERTKEATCEVGSGFESRIRPNLLFFTL